MAEIKDFARMCNSFQNCVECPLCPTSLGRSCLDTMQNNTEFLDSAVDKWCKEHPQKTYLQDFLEKFPDAATDDGVPVACRADLYGTCTCTCRLVGKDDYTVDCRKCWNEVMPDA